VPAFGVGLIVGVENADRLVENSRRVLAELADAVVRLAPVAVLR
jgi:hypothetical protein